MGKRSQRHSVRYEKDRSSCMWGLISVFDFRHGRLAPKLLPDRRNRSKHYGSGLFKNKFEILSNLDETGRVATLDGEETTRAKVTIETDKSSVKKLIEEEMLNEQSKMNDASNFEVERHQCESAHDNQIRRDHKGTKKARKKNLDMDAFDSNVAEILKSECSCDQNTSQQSAKNIGLDEIIRELCHKIHLESKQCVKHYLNGEAGYKNHDIEEKLVKAMKDFINQKLINAKDLMEDQTIQNSRKLMDVLKLIISDEKLFLQKGEEPKLGADLSEQKLVELRKSEDVGNDKCRHFFQRKIKSQEVNSSKANEFVDVSNRIVILKPRPTESQDFGSKSNFASSAASISSVRSNGSSDRVGSHFFLSEIKRKLKYAVGKKQIEVSSFEISDRVGHDNPGKRSPGKEHFYIERIAKPSIVSKRADKKGRTKGSGVNTKHEIVHVSNIYIEAKKHLSEMLSSGHDGVEPSSRQIPKRLGRMLSLSEYNSSPIGSPGRNWENSFVTAKMRFSAIDKLKQVNENMWSPKRQHSGSLLGQEAQNSKSKSPTSDNSPNYTAQAPNISTCLQEDIISDVEVEENVCPSKDGMNLAGFVKEETFITIASCDPSACSSPRDEQNCDMSNLSEDNKYLELLEQEDPNDDNQLLSSPLASPCSVTPKKVADQGRSIDFPERTSPVSVLEPLFTEDDISPSRTISQHDQPLHIQFEEPETSISDQAKCATSIMEEKESVFECVKLLIQSSGCNLDEFYSRWLSSNLLLDPSLVDEMQFFFNQHCSYLLFDCINEVLVEICENYFGCSFVKSGIRPLPNLKSAILEISEVVHWHLLHLPLPRSIDQIVRKDMARTETWMDIRFDMEAIGFNLGEDILVDLLEDTILGYISESPRSEQVYSSS